MCRFLVSIVLLISLPLYSKWRPPVYYQYQIGVSAGVGDNSAPKMELGQHMGFQVRAGHHTMGIRIEEFGNIAIFEKPSYMKCEGLYYGWTWVGQYALWQVTCGGGLFDYQFNHGSNHVVSDVGVFGEMCVVGFTNWRGNGLGLKFSGNVNPLEGYFSWSLFLQAGWAWNNKNSEDRVQ